MTTAVHFSTLDKLLKRQDLYTTIGPIDAKKEADLSLGPKGLVEVLEKIPHGLWPIFMPRVYKRTDRYCSVKLPAATMISSVMAALDHTIEINRPMRAVFTASDHIRRFNSQILFVGRDLLKAATLSDPPKDLKWMDLHMPYEAAVIMFPKGSIKDSDGNEFDFVAYSRRRKGQVLNHELVGRKDISRTMEHDSFTAFTMATNGDGNVLEAAWTPEMSPWIHDFIVDPIIPANDTEIALTEEESGILRLLTTLIFKLCLVLEARPTLLSSGRKVSNFKKREGVEVWTPNIIGLNYKIKSEELEATVKGTHASPRMHWRRGHTRNQPIGTRTIDKKDRLRRIVWIEPCLVGGNS